VTGDADGGRLQAAEATAAGELLQPLMSEAFVSAHPDLFEKVFHAAGAIAMCCSHEVGCLAPTHPLRHLALRCQSVSLPPLIPRAHNIPHASHAQPVQAFPLHFGPVGASFLGLFASEQLSQKVRSSAAGPLMVLRQPGCTAAVLAAAGGEGAVDAVIAAAKNEGGLLQGTAFMVLAELAGADDAVRERAASADAALLPLAVERMSAAAAGAASPDALYVCQGVLHLLSKLTAPCIPAAACAHAVATPGLAVAAVDLLMALGSEKWAAARQEWAAARQESAAAEEAPLCEELEAAILTTLAMLMRAAGIARPSAFDALTSRGALPRVLALLRSA
jgi:hypothetical protein